MSDTYDIDPGPYGQHAAVSQAEDLRPPASISNYVPPLPGPVPGPADLQLALAAYAQRKLAEQSWWQKSSNTVTTAVGSVTTLAGALATYYLTQGTSVPQWLTMVIAVLGSVGTIIGTKATKNGFTYQGAAQLQQAVLDPVVLSTVQKVLAQEPFPAHIAEQAEAQIERAAREAQEWINRTGNGQR
ncbi:hypothetical protein SEA_REDWATTLEHOG_213 [Gordonia phage RedWattleHog]|uniref:Holin n=1 Tax=Gordonia phage Stormageddon TaxID=2656541 RepID=A0A649VS98_9CAUD|nr:holin [Gordonia phage Stormageddon]QGJ95074.1 hypothetical protein SEA_STORMAGEDDON_214 [Gordonia phage Stormageddon]QLF83716.1 hypothetical protein SEA_REDWATTLEHOG_213 [Gordonia phage RedWattleHog]